MLTKVGIILLLVSKTLEHQVCNKTVTDINRTVDISKGNHLWDGAVYFGGDRYGSTEYFVDVGGVERGCVCLKKPCVRKCCSLGFGYDADKKICVNTTAVFDPPVWDDLTQLKGRNASETFHFIFGKVICKPDEARIRSGVMSDHLHLGVDGKLYIKLNSDDWGMQGLDSFCIDTFVTEHPNGSITSKLEALVCFGEPAISNEQYSLTSSCMIISCVFLVATLAVYAWLPELRNLHGKVLMVYLACLLVGFLCFATLQIFIVFDAHSVQVCFALTIASYWSLEAAFFWLNVMSFDIWWTFSGKRGPSGNMSSQGRFYAYCAYAFGIPTFLTVLLVTLEYSGLSDSEWLPNMRGGGCFLHGKSKLLYFYGPIFIMCIANITFFILTAIKLTQIQKQTSVLKSKDSSTHDRHRNDKQRLLLYLKLFTVMGVNWILEVVSALFPELQDKFWKYTDVYNVLIGVVIFIIFVCKRKTFRLIKKRYQQLRGIPMSRSQTTTSRTVSCRDEVQMGYIKQNPAHI